MRSGCMPYSWSTIANRWKPKQQLVKPLTFSIRKASGPLWATFIALAQWDDTHSSLPNTAQIPHIFQLRKTGKETQSVNLYTVKLNLKSKIPDWIIKMKRNAVPMARIRGGKIIILVCPLEKWSISDKSVLKQRNNVKELSATEASLNRHCFHQSTNNAQLALFT